MNYEAVIGLEVHAQLLTNTKIFCGCRASYGDEPNTNVCPVCLGMPGALPVLSKKALEFAILAATALECKINSRSIFARKNYFYPDLPKGYQISQFDEPLAVNGRIEIELENGEKKTVHINRLHMEEDAGKNLHEGFNDSDRFSYIDMNRCGIPLIEIVSEPDIRTPEEASVYLQEIRKILRYIGVCDGNMEEGSLRCDANMSIRPAGTQPLGVKTEVKNMNSFRSVRNAIAFEIDRQIKLLNSGERITQETRLWNQASNTTIAMRSKEQSHDYRYFPEPDLTPVIIDDEMIRMITAKIPELPKDKKDRFVKDYQIPRYNAQVLTESKALAGYFETACKHGGNPSSISNWILSELLRELKQDKIEIEDCPIKPEYISELVALVEKGTISGKMGKDVFARMYSTGSSPSSIVQEQGMVQVSDEGQIADVIDKVLKENHDKVRAWVEGKEQLFGFFVGQIMKASQGKANPGIVNNLLKQRLEGFKKS
jgi:aspartyl-tRNA(Asn)/glutamyl-tRNA(Gln) amidotransferase subunit B